MLSQVISGEPGEEISGKISGEIKCAFYEYFS